MDGLGILVYKMINQNKKIALVTGATGFVGSHLARHLLQENYEVHILTRKTSDKWRIRDISQKLHDHAADLCDKENLIKIIQNVKPEYVFHSATYGGYPSQKDFNNIIKTNILGSLNLFQSLENCGSLKKIINIGSSSEYGQKSEPMKETDLLEPNTPYAAAKASQTLFGRYFSKNHNLPLITLRPFSVYGPAEEPGRLIADLMMSAIRKRKVNLSSPLPRRDFIFVDDILSASIKAANSSVESGEIFNVGSGKDLSIGEITANFEEILGRKLDIEWGVEEKKRSFDVGQRWVADISKIKKTLDWEPVWSLKDGLKKTYQWYSDNNHLYDSKN